MPARRTVLFAAIAVSLRCGATSPAVDRPEADRRLTRSVNSLVTSLLAQTKSSDMTLSTVGVLPFQEYAVGPTFAGDFVGERFVRPLRDARVDLVQRGALEEALWTELCKSSGGEISDDTVVTVGKKVSAQAILTGKLTELGDGWWRIDARVIAVESSKVLAAGDETILEASIPERLRGKRYEPRSRAGCATYDPNASAAAPEEASTPRSLATIRSGSALQVGIMPWGGFAGGLYMNGGLEPTARSRFLNDHRVRVRFRVMHSIEESIDAWENGQVDVLWLTIDDLPTEYRGLEHHSPRIILQTAWSRGEEVMMVRRGIRTLNDLKGKRIALWPNTTAHSFLLVSLDLAGLKYSQVQVVPAISEKDAARKMIEDRSIDAAIVWIPHDEEIKRKVRGARELESTKDASHLIAESLVVKQRVLDARRDDIKRFAKGWLVGNARINTQPSARREAVRIMQRALRMSRRVAQRELELVRLTTLGDNRNFFGLNGTAYKGEKGEDLLEYFWRRYEIDVGNVSSQHPSWAALADSSIVAGMKLRGAAHRPEPAPRFTRCQRWKNSARSHQLSKKAVQVRFGSGGHQLDPADKRTIVEKFGHLAEIFFHDCIMIEGHTDRVGSAQMNLKLSRRRALSAKRFLVEHFGFDEDRIITIGHGEAHAPGEGDDPRSRRTDFELLH